MKKTTVFIVGIIITFMSFVQVFAEDATMAARTEFQMQEEYILPTALYDFSQDEADNQIELLALNSEAVSAEINNILTTVKDDMTDVEKALVVHDYMALNYKYDYDNYLNDTIPFESYRMDGLLTNKTGVCQAYAETYKYIMNLLGIDCVVVSSDSMNHAWNIIKINNEWYHVDVTWDDPVYDRIGRARHEYFLLSDSEIKNREHYGWTTNVTADDTTYDDYFWKDIDSAIIIKDGYIFYVDDLGIRKKTGFNGISEIIYPMFNVFWEVKDKEGSFWVGTFSGLGYYNDRLYFNTTNSICSIDLNGSDYKKLISVDTSKMDIYGLYMNGSTITFGMMPDPNSKENIAYIYDLENKMEQQPIEIELVSASAANGSIEVNFKNLSNYTQTFDAMCATYDGNNCLKDIEVLQIKINNNSSVETTFAFDTSWSSYKIFAWDSAKNIIPLAECMESK